GVLPHRRVRVALGSDQAVGDEVGIVGNVAELTAVGVEGPTVALGEDAVVLPLPDEPTLQAVVGLDGGPVVGEAPVAVAHGVGVLTHDQGPVGAPAGGRRSCRSVLGPLDDGLDGRVHRAHQV